MLINLVKIFVPTAMAFFFGLFLTPIATHFFYKYKMWKKHSRSNEELIPDFHRIHNHENELITPRIGGVIIWVSVFLVTLLFYLTSIFFPSDDSLKMNFL